jgi:Domain of unknown function (DUF4158)
MSANCKRLNVLSQAEQFALYGLPDFDDSQRMEYFVSQSRNWHWHSAEPPFMLNSIAHYKSRFYSATVSGPRIFFALLRQQTTQIVSRDVTPGFIVAELIVFLREQKIVRPGYTTLQDLISEALSAERNRLGKLLNGVPIADGKLWNGYVFSAGDH